jgi:hypothetical protein
MKIDLELMVSQLQIWKGTLNELIRKNNQAAVPMKLFLGSLMAKK